MCHLVLVLQGPARDVNPALAAAPVQPEHNMEKMSVIFLLFISNKSINLKTVLG